MSYLDNSTVTKPSDEALAAMQPFFENAWGLPSAPHKMGEMLVKPIESAYHSIYDLLDASEEDHFVFTSSGTEAVNHVTIAAYQEQTVAGGRNHYLTARTDEASSIMSHSRLETLGCVAKMVEVDSHGRVTVDALADAITPRTALLSISWASGLTGVIQPIEDLTSLCRERGIWLHVDASHVLGKLDFSFDDCGADMLSFEGSLIHAPAGTGGLMWRPSLKLPPLLWGGSEQGAGRAGPFSVALLSALGVAAKQSLEARDFVSMESARLRDKFESGVQKKIPEAAVLFSDAERVPHISCIAFPGVSSEALLFLLQEHGVYATLGGGNQQQIGLLLEACGIDPALANTALSFSLSRTTTDEEIDKAIEIVAEMVTRVRTLSKELIP